MPVSNDALTKKADRINFFYRITLMLLSLFIAGVAAASVVKVYGVSNSVNRQTTAIINYLDCVGHLPVVGRQQSDVDKCLDGMRKNVRGVR